MSGFGNINDYTELFIAMSMLRKSINDANNTLEIVNNLISRISIITWKFQIGSTEWNNMLNIWSQLSHIHHSLTQMQ